MHIANFVQLVFTAKQEEGNMKELSKLTAAEILREHLSQLSTETILPNDLLQLKNIGLLLSEYSGKINELILKYVKEGKEVGNYESYTPAGRRSGNKITKDMLDFVKSSDYDVKDLFDYKLKGVSELEKALSKKDQALFINPPTAGKETIKLKK